MFYTKHNEFQNVIPKTSFQKKYLLQLSSEWWDQFTEKINLYIILIEFLQ